MLDDLLLTLCWILHYVIELALIVLTQEDNYENNLTICIQCMRVSLFEVGRKGVDVY